MTKITRIRDKEKVFGSDC